jgi:hypothetical protein
VAAGVISGGGGDAFTRLSLVGPFGSANSP